MSEEVYECGGEAEDIAEEQTQEEYDSEDSKDIKEEDYQERHPDDNVRSKADGKLEKRLGKLRVSKDDSMGYDGRNVEELIDRELSEDEIEALEQELRETKYFPARLDSVEGYVKSWKGQGKATIKDGIKGLVYLIKGFIDVEGEEDSDVYEKIARMKNAPILYISGALEYPMNISEIEEHSGYDIAHIKERMDPDKLNDIIEYATKVTGQKPIVIGFSDGGKSIENYIEKHGMDKVSMFYAIAASKFNAENPSKVVFIDGKKDRLAILEKNFSKKTDSDVFNVDGGHTWMCYDPVTIEQIFEIIEKTARVEGSNFKSFNTKKAA